MPDVPEVRVVVVAFHAAELLGRTLAALQGSLRVVVVDNSSDPDVERVTYERHAEYVDAGSNLGFAAGVNLGLRAVGPGVDVLLLNPDAIVVPADITRLQRHLREDDRCAAVSPALRDATGMHAQRTAWPFPSPRRMWAEAVGLGPWVARRSGFVVGAVLLLRAETLAEVGPFDERFFLYAEEADWQRRAAEAGWHCREVTGVVARHVGAATSGDPARREALFHAGTETYIRKWFGSRGWVSYRAAALVAAAGRSVSPGGARRRAARARLELYGRGPRRVAGFPPRQVAAKAGRRIVHLVVTDAFAGVERYVCEVARTQARQGSSVVVIGGDPTRMSGELGGIRHLPAATVRGSVVQLFRVRRSDVVHTHMTAAEIAACLVFPCGRPVILSTRHFAGQRGSSRIARLVSRWVRARLDQQIAISEFVAGQVGEPTQVVPNGVQSRTTHLAGRLQTVLCLQRLEVEKSTDLALRAWAASGVAAHGWRLLLAGDGSQRAVLEDLVVTLGIQSSVEFLGHVADTQAQLETAGLLLATARAEPFGLSVAEAMASGTPVLASDGGAHRELLGPNGWFFRAEDVESLTAALSTATSRASGEVDEYGSLLRERQRTLFDLEDHVHALDAAYEKVLLRTGEAGRRRRGGQ